MFVRTNLLSNGQLPVKRQPSGGVSTRHVRSRSANAFSPCRLPSVARGHHTTILETPPNIAGLPSAVALAHSTVEGVPSTTEFAGNQAGQRKDMARPSRNQTVLDCGGKRSATPLWQQNAPPKSGVAATLCHRSPKSSLNATTLRDGTAKKQRRQVGLFNAPSCPFAFALNTGLNLKYYHAHARRRPKRALEIQSRLPTSRPARWPTERCSLHPGGRLRDNSKLIQP